VSIFSDKNCLPCEEGGEPLRHGQVEKYLRELGGGWVQMSGTKIRKVFKFKGFKEAMVFINKVADIAEKEGHHPDIYISYSKVTIELSTHAVQGLSENDFILADKIQKI